jgi:DNA-binding GntR family transcriptional regulator
MNATTVKIARVPPASEAGVSAEAEAYSHILGRIRRGELKPGERLRAEDVAEEIGTSRMPVREAMRRLDAEGYLTIRPNRGAIVAGYTRAQIQELFEIRSVLEGLAVRLAMERVTDDQLQELKELHQRMVQAEAQPDRWLVRHAEFHAALCGLSGRPRLVKEVMRLHNALEPHLRVWIAHITGPMDAGRDHEMLLQAIASRYPQHAETVMRDHVLDTAPAVVSFLEAHPEAGLLLEST